MKHAAPPRVSLLRELRLAGATILVFLAAGALGFKLAGGAEWSFFDALYMTAITISTVGFMEVHPLTPAGRVVAILLIFGGAGTLLYVLIGVAEATLHGQLLWRRRVSKTISALSGHFIVCGYGRVGRAICRTLREQGLAYTVISLEQPPEARDELFIVGDATDDALLLAAGIERARALVAVLRSDADNIYTILAARALRPGLFVISRCSEERSASKMRAAGAQRVINPYERGGFLMAQVLLRPQVVDFLDEVSRGSGFRVSFEEIKVDAASRLVGQSLRDSPLRRELDVIVTGILRADGRKVFNPAPGEVIGAGDVLIVMGPLGALDQLARIAG